MRSAKKKSRSKTAPRVSDPKRASSRNRVNVAEFKVRMGTYLKQIKAGGEVVIMDRSHPVARVTAFREDEPFKLQTTPPLLTASDGLGKLRFEPVAGKRTDSFSALLEERSKNEDDSN